MVVRMTYAADGQRRRGRPPRISRDHIVDAACELGIQNLTMAAVADRLGVTHQSLYGWVQDRDELIDLVSDRLIDGLEAVMKPDPGAWRESLRALAAGLREVARRNPGYANAALLRYRIGPSQLRLNDCVIRHLVDAGHEPPTAQRIYADLNVVVIGWAAREEAYASVRSHPEAVLDALNSACSDRAVGQITVAAIATDLVALADARFDFLVRSFLAGLPDPPEGKPLEEADRVIDVRVPAAASLAVSP
jgi:AcrR family transcriptional regulator